MIVLYYIVLINFDGTLMFFLKDLKDLGLPRLAASMLCLDKNFLRNLPGDVGGLDAYCCAAHSGIRVLIWSTVFVL